MKKVDMYLMSYGKYFDVAQIPMLKERMANLTDAQWTSIEMVQLREPMLVFILSLFFGGLGVDRFMIGKTGSGVAKLLTCGGFGIWAIVDWFLIMGMTKEYNLLKLNEALCIVGA